jgi:hypothetical protein
MGDHSFTQSPVHADAVNRALRTLWTGFGVDAATAIGAGTLLLVNEVDVNSELFWTSMGVLALKSIVTSFASYLVRLNITPKAS